MALHDLGLHELVALAALAIWATSAGISITRLRSRSAASRRRTVDSRTS
jgi:hypothetical protein